MKYLVRVLLLCLSVLMATQGYAATITASVDRSLVNAGETVQLTLEVNGSVDDDPDFRLLEKDFEILSRNQSTSMQMINGSFSSRKQWVLMLMPKDEGVITIPAISFGSDKSNAVVITIKPTQTSRPGVAAEDIFLQVKAEPKDSPVQAQVIYSVRVYIATNVSNASLSEPKLSDADAVVKKLGEDRRFDTVYLGRRYQVVERRYAIFPQQSGKLSIAPVTFDAQVAEDRGYGGNIFRRFGQPRRLRSESIEIDIKPIPATQKAKTWLPASAMKLQDEWTRDPSSFKVGEAITRTVTLIATGLTAAQLPEIMPATPQGLKVYPDQASLEDQVQDSGITGVRREKIAMIASRPGDYVMPAITIHWWNSKTQKQEKAVIPERKIRVIAAAGISTPPAAIVPQVIPDNTITTSPAPVDTGEQKTSSEAIPQPSFWKWLSLFLGAGWLLTLLFIAYRNSGNRKAPQMKAPENNDRTLNARKMIEKKLRRACQLNNAQATKEALLQWGNHLFPEQELTSIGELAQYLEGPVADQINALSEMLYSASSEEWQGSALWHAIERYNKKQVKRLVEKESLAPLHSL